MTAPALSLRNLTKSYGRHRGISDVTLDVPAGEVFGFLGPNGAGKSTTIKTVMNLIKADSGSAAILGIDSRQGYAAAHAKVGYLAGDMELDSGLTGQQFLDYCAGLRGLRDRSLMKRYSDRLDADLNKKIRHLSRGNKQKIGLIAALMHDPELLILDEPTSGLDPLMQAEFNRIIREHTERGKTVFISSHILGEVQTICDRVGFIREGRLIKVQPLSELLQSAAKHVRVVFAGAAPIKQLKGLAGVSGWQELHNQLAFEYSGDVNQLVNVLAKSNLASLSIGELDLEELFLRYYGEAADV